MRVPSYSKHPRAYVTFQVRLPPELKRQLEEYAFRTGQSQIAIVVAALEDYFRQHPRKRSPEEPPSPGLGETGGGVPGVEPPGPAPAPDNSR